MHWLLKMDKTVLCLTTIFALTHFCYGGPIDLCIAEGYLPKDITTRSKISELNEDSDVNPEEFGDYHESDILIPSHKFCKDDPSRLLWPSGRVYYEISPDFDWKSKAQIKDAMTHISNQTCIEFVPRSSNQSDFVKFTNKETGCWTQGVGRLGGEQIVNLQVPTCLRKVGSIVHQLAHVLGLGHEHNRPDRDQHIEVLWHNVNETHASKFNNAESHADMLDLPYDPYSIMHYSPNAFAKDNRLATIKPKGTDVHIHKIGQRERLSNLDILKINKLYEKTCSIQTLKI